MLKTREYFPCYLSGDFYPQHPGRNHLSLVLFELETSLTSVLPAKPLRYELLPNYKLRIKLLVNYKKIYTFHNTSSFYFNKNHRTSNTNFKLKLCNKIKILTSIVSSITLISYNKPTKTKEIVCNY